MNPSFRLCGALMALTLSGCATTTNQAGVPHDGVFAPAYIADTMRKVADWQIGNWTSEGFKKPKYNWTYCAAYVGIFAAGDVTGDGKYHAFLRKIGDELEWKTGTRRYFADDYCVGQVYAQMYARYREPKMLKNWQAQADEIVAQPHTESLSLSSKGIMDREWAWCDALFMGPTGLSYLSTATGERKYLEAATRLWWKTSDFLYSPKDRLFYRDESYFDKREKNGEKVFWSRGNGWVMGALVRVLSNMKQDDPERPRLVAMYREMAQRIVSLQTADGSWHSSLLDPASYPARETSGTSFYTYAILWGLNNGVLDHARYWPAVARAWPVLVDSVQPDGMLGFVQPVGAAPARSTRTAPKLTVRATSCSPPLS
ncbi:MAG: glycoside hydrolase family 88 protein [Massilia sp.]